MRTRRLAAVSAGALLVAAALCATLTAQSARLTFIGVALGDSATTQADRRLTEYFYEKVGARFSHEELEYEQAIRRLVNWRPEDGAFVARTTPYAYVVAELLGANVEPLATYVSDTTGRTTYRSYFVVSRKAFETRPELPDLLRFLTQRKDRAKFVYQSQFSTSSFFLPSLFFRAHGIFQMPESTGPLTAIAAEKIAEASSSRLVELVAKGEADVAAVWDGVKARVEAAGPLAASGQVYFIALPTAIPNDLLICSSGLDAAMKNQLRDAIGRMAPQAINLGDFRTWQNINEATEARLALGDLRQAARANTAPVTVEIQLAAREAQTSVGRNFSFAGSPGSAGSAAAMTGSLQSLVDAARQAVRLSQTEFVLFDNDFHKQIDFRWTIEPIHDGAIVLHSAIPGSDVDEQVFQLSFRDPDDLTARILSIIQSRLHRIRYVWPYSAGAPIVMRDSAFALPAGTSVKVQRITWLDPARNQFRAGEVFESRIQQASFYRYELAADDFSRQAAGDRLDPLSNGAYRVILMRPVAQPLLFQLLTVALVACFAFAGASAAWTLFRRRSIRPTSSHPSR